MMWCGQIFKDHGRESPCLEVSCHIFLEKSVVVRIENVKGKNIDTPLPCPRADSFYFFNKERGKGREEEGAKRRRLMRERLGRFNKFGI